MQESTVLDKSPMQRIIFLDIDGPVIPNGCFAIDRLASADRIFSPVCIHLVRLLAIVAEAKIVTNSSHNFIHSNKTNTDLQTDLHVAGIDKALFHGQWRTQFPAYRRLEAIMAWQRQNGMVDWVAFDDERFTRDHRLIWINPDIGITPEHYDKAAQHWGTGSFWGVGINK